MAYDKMVDSAQLDSGLTSVANAIRAKSGGSSQLAFPAGFVSAIGAIQTGGGGGVFTDTYNRHIGADEKWHRPTGWPNLDDLPAVANADYFYLSFNNTGGDAFLTLGCTTNSGNWVLERGTVSGTTFTVAETQTYASTTQANRYVKSADNTWGDYPVFRVSAAGGITKIILGNSPSNNGVYLSKNYSRMIEARLVISAVCDISSFASIKTLERFSFINGKIKDFSFDGCWSLAEIPGYEDWDVTAVTSMANRFRNCESLICIDLHKWNLSSATTFGDTNGSIFSNCHSLKSVNAKNLCKSTVTSIGALFVDCFSLTDVDLSGWNTSNVTDMQRMFQNCYSLQSVDLSDFDTGKVTTMNQMFYAAYSLQSIIGIEDWDVSACTTFQNMFLNCAALRPLDLSGWELDALTDLFKAPAMTSYIRVVNESGWDTRSMTGGSTFLNPNNAYYVNWDGWTLPNDNADKHPNGEIFVEYYPPVINVSHNYANMVSLDHASLLRILNILPIVQTAQTLTLGNVKARLSADEIAIATAKGWTVA